MITLPEYLIIEGYSKSIFDNFKLFQFENTYKKRFKNYLNYEIKVKGKILEEDLPAFNNFIQDTLKKGVLEFHADFEFLRDTDVIDDFKYKLYEKPSLSRLEDDIFSFELDLIRMNLAATQDMILVKNNLLNIIKQSGGWDSSIEANTNITFDMEAVLVSLQNIYDMGVLHANDYSATYYAK